ncbi:MAG: GNAT family N-acetyltransferase [Enterococcus raffinosus]
MRYSKRIADFSDYSRVVSLINDGKRQMQITGITQWDENYPNKQLILQDIEQKKLWLYGEQYEACVTLAEKESIALIQRLVVHSQHQRSGIAHFILTDILQKEKNKKEIMEVRLSTNHSNLPMQKLLTSLKFVPSRKYLIPGREKFGNFIEFIYPMR